MRAVLPLQVIVVSSSSELKKLYGTTLRSIGADVRWHVSLQEVLDERETLKPSILLLDLDSQTEPVKLFSEELRALFPDSEWVALSSEDSAQIAMRCLRAGFADFLVKPMNPGELAWAILRCQQRRQARVEWSQSPTRLLEAVKEMSACSSATLLRITALQFLKQAIGARSVRWSTRAKNYSRMQWKFFNTNQTLWIPSRIFLDEGILVTGLKKKPTQECLKEAKSLVEHLELSHANLSRLEQMRQQTFLDDLTGLYNARYLRHCLDKAVQDYREKQETFCVLFIDVDKFKAVNDEHGHLVGSGLLKALGRSLKNLVRTQDSVFRYGGDEFVVILAGTHLARGIQVAERLRKSIEKRVFQIEESSVRATLSIGVASFPDHAEKLESLLKMADQAMYDAKRKSRNAVETLPIPSYPQLDA
jgi:diguanylate cyclase (GGDEF)-like protein